MKWKLAFICVIGTLFLNVYQAEAQTDTLKLTASHLSAAKQLVITTGMTDFRFTTMRNNTIKSLSASFPEKNKEKFVMKLSDFFDKYLPSDRFKDIFIKMYAEVFTEDELRELIKFYSSPLGKKIVNELPQLLQKSMLMDQRILAEHNSELQSIIEEAVKE